MGARQKLNHAHATGILVFSAVLGAATGSWLVFLITAALGAAVSLQNGDIRPHSRHPPQSRR